MNRNTNLIMGNIPKIHARRSKIDRSKSVHTVFNAGELIPVYTDLDILPGDTVQMDVQSLVRLATPIVPVMDNLIMDLYAFFCPYRLVWTHWKNFWGENEDPWTQETEYTIPQIEAPEGGWQVGTLADYMTIPVGIDHKSVSALGFRAVAKIWSDWFRDENLKSACHMYDDDTTRTGSNGTDYVTDVELGGFPPKVAKTADLFTKCQPSPQKGPSVSVPIGTKASVYTGPDHSLWNPNYNEKYPLRGSIVDVENAQPVSLTFGNYYASDFFNPTMDGDGKTVEMSYHDSQEGSRSTVYVPTNLYADLNNATSSTINELRTAFAIQKYYEAAALYGTRYIEFIRSIFSVESSDARMQRSEYLGGTRVPINMDAIVQTSSTDAVTPQGNASGYSCTRLKDSLFTKSFEEHGALFVFACVRVEKRSYQQGLHKMFTRKTWKDFYNPFFANLGSMPVYNEEIYCQGDNITTLGGEIVDRQVFGYQEAFAEYRYANNDCTGYMRSKVTGSLDFYHYADDYDSLPSLGSSWIDEPKETVDRTIAVSSMITKQLIADFWYNVQYTRVMPVYSMPGLIDHV